MRTVLLAALIVTTACASDDTIDDTSDTPGATSGDATDATADADDAPASPEGPGTTTATAAERAADTTDAPDADDGDTGPPDEDEPAQGADPTEPPAETTDPTETTEASGPDEAATPDLDGLTVDLEPVGSFDLPVDLVDHDGALWIVEQGGRILRLEADGGDATTVADLGERISGANEQGLLGLAFGGGNAYLNYTATDGTTTVSEVPVRPDGELDVGGERVVIEIEQPFSNHNAGDLLFDAAGHLVIPLGDGGSAGDPNSNGPDPTTLLGTILRIDPTPTDGASYSIPDDNPFAAGGDGRPEVWAWGLRNPWRVDLDPATGDLWIADVGQNAQEEVNHVPGDGGPLPGRADFYGWSAFEGDLVFDESVDPTGAVAPVHTYDHGEDGCSVSGGAVYRGDRISGLAGAYVYGDYCSGRLWAFDPITGDNVLLRDDLVGITTVRRGIDGELYVVQHGGDVWRLAPVS